MKNFLRRWLGIEALEERVDAAFAMIATLTEVVGDKRYNPDGKPSVDGVGGRIRRETITEQIEDLLAISKMLAKTNEGMAGKCDLGHLESRMDAKFANYHSLIEGLQLSLRATDAIDTRQGYALSTLNRRVTCLEKSVKAKVPKTAKRAPKKPAKRKR